MTAIPQESRASDMPREARMTLTAELLSRLVDCDSGAETELVDAVVLLNRCVAESLAARYAGRGIDLDDLRQVAYEGLVKAVHRFEPDQRHDFLTFAVPTIRGELQRHFRDRGWVVRPPRRVQELQQRIGRVTDLLHQDLGRAPLVAELVEALGVERTEYDDAVQAFGCFRPTSLDEPSSGEGDQPLGDLLPGHGQGHDAVEARVTLAPVLRELSARDRRLLYLRFVEDRTQAQIGQELGVTQMQVSRRLSGIYEQLRGAIGSPIS